MVMLHLGLADALLHRDAREVGHFLAQAGEAIEERRLAGVGRSDDGDDVRARALSAAQAALPQPRNRRSRGNRS